MTAEHLRDSAMSALILGFFASCWFGWAQEKPPGSWKLPLIIGAVASLLVAIAGGILAWQNWSESSALEDSGSMTRFIVIFWVEVALIAIGSGLLAWQGHAAWIACWTALIVGIHFLPMGPIFDEPDFYILGTLLAVVAIGAFTTARQYSIAPSAITGAGSGLVLVIFAIWNLVRTLA